MGIDISKPQNKKIYPIGMLDLFKGVGMLMIILVHCRAYGAKNDFIDRSIDMLSSGALVFFEIASGFGIRKMKPAKMLKKTAKENLLPYAFCGICAVLVKLLIQLALVKAPAQLMLEQHTMRKALEKAAGTATAFLTGSMGYPKTVFGIPNGSVGPAWFFLALFWGIQSVNLILRIGDKRKEMAAAVAMTGIGYVLQHMKFGYFCIDRGFIAVLPIYLGYLCRREHLPDKMPQWKSILLTAFVGICGAVVYKVLRGSPWFIRGIGKFLLFYSEALLMLLLSIMYCGSKSGPLTQMICYVGKNSLLFLIVHTIEYECLPWGGFIRALGLPEIPELGNMLCFALRTVGCAVMVRLMERPFTRMITRVSRL